MKNFNLYMIDRFYDEASVLVYRSTGFLLRKPNIDIFVSDGRLNGYWKPSERVIGLNERLFRYHEENAVKFVLWHEIAHQIVTEVYKYDGPRDHGEHFKRACLILGIDDKACHSEDFLSKFKSGNFNPVLKKIEKLLDTSGRTEKEAQIFLNKANEIMLKNNISINEVLGKDRLFLKRQVGENYKRFPTHLFKLGIIMEKFYGVRYIKSFAYVNVGGVRKPTYHIELFGEPSKLDLAEYVYENILRKANELYEDYKKDTERTKYYGKKISKKAYFSGLFNGFYDKLNESQNEVMEELKSKGEIVILDDPILKEYYNKAYKVMTSFVSSSHGVGYSDGYDKGKNMTINSGIHSSRGFMLNA